MTNQSQNDGIQMPYIVHQKVVASMERTIHRLWITNLILILVVLILGGFLFWLSNQYERVDESTQTVTQEVISESDGGAILSGDVIVNGSKGETDSNNDNED